MKRSRPTLKDIAAELNLSHPTVSRGLAGHEVISAETRARIREVADRIGYVANSGAQLLRKGASNVIGLLLPDITNEFYAAAAQRLANDYGGRNLRVLLSITANDPDRELSLVRALLEARPSGIVAALTPTPREETLALLGNTHCVQFMQVHAGLAGASVTVEDSGGARLAMEHLLGLGHRRIGFVGPSPDQSIGAARLRGLTRALKAADHELPPELIRIGPSVAAYGAEAVEALLALPDPPTALYLASAPLSLGGMRVLGASGLVIPEQMSIVVAGSSAWYSAWPGGLTSITLPMANLTDTAATLLAEEVQGNHDRKVELAFELILRGSTGSPRMPLQP